MKKNYIKDLILEHKFTPFPPKPKAPQDLITIIVAWQNPWVSTGHCRNYSKILLTKPSKVETIIKSHRKSKLYLSLIKSPSKYRVSAFAIF